MAYFGILDESDARCFRVNASVMAASWILVAASLILLVVNHFIVAASRQKVQDDTTPAERRFHSDRWLQSKTSGLTVTAVDLSMSRSDEEDGYDFEEPSDPVISPVEPRFTDWYQVLTKQGHELETETAIVPIDENSSQE